MRQNRAVRVMRGSLAAAVATFAALTSHVTAGGQMPGWVGIVVPLVLSVVVCTVLAGRRLALWRLALAVAVSQLLFHVLFVLGTFSPSPASPGMSGHHMAGAMPMPMPTGDMASAHLHADAPMWFMHAIAAVVTILVLHRGERVCLRLREIAVEFAQWCARRLTVLLRPSFPPFRPVPPTSARSLRTSPSPLVYSVIRRGPPAAAAF